MTKPLLKTTILVVFISLITCIVLCLLWCNAVFHLLTQSSSDNYELACDWVMSEPLIQIETEFTEPNLVYLGSYKLTYYCACVKCCGKIDGITATGTRVCANRTVAVDPSVIPYGSHLLINGQVYIAEDCGCAIKEKHIDIYVPTHEEAIQRGVNYADIYLLTTE